MADSCVESAFAEVIQNGKVLDRSEDEKPLKDSEVAAVIGTGKGNVKNMGVASDENGADESKVQKEGKIEESNGEEEKVDFLDDSRAEELKALEKDEGKLKGRGRGRAKKVSPGEKVEVKQEAEKKEAEIKKQPRKEPGTPTPDRPARERKSIDRFAASTEKEKVREFKIEKGTGTLLRDIPNIVYKMSKRTGGDDLLQLLHKLLYGKRVKPHHAKQNILQFSGYVWGTNQDKERVKTKERLEKCVKESLLQVSELLDLSIKTSSKKEDVVATLLEFLESPHKTTDKLLEEKEAKPKGKKRKRTPKKGAGKRATGQTSRKRRKSEGSLAKNKAALVDEEEREESIEDEEEDLEPEEPQKKKRHHKDSDDEEYNVKSKRPKRKTKGSSKKGIVNKAAVEDPSSKDAEDSEEDVKLKSPKKVSRKSSSKTSKASLQSPGKGATKNEPASSKVFSRKKKKDDDQEEEEVKGNVKETLNKEKPSREKSSNKPSMKAEGKSRTKGKNAEPSDEELRSAICDLLKEADFSTVTFTDVVKQLERQFNIDLTEKKGHVKVLIREEISKIAEEDDGEDENAGEDAEGDKEESDPGDLADQAAEE